MLPQWAQAQLAPDWTASVTTLDPTELANYKGWFLDLSSTTLPYEQVVTTPVTLAGVTYFNTYRAKAADANATQLNGIASSGIALIGIEPAMTLAYHEARHIIKRHVNASSEDILITDGTGMTGVVNKFQRY